MNKELIEKIIVMALPIIVVLFIIYLVAKKFGLVKSSESIKADKEKAKNLDTLKQAKYFNPLYYQNIANKPLGELEAKEIAKDIYDAWGVFNDDEPAIYSAFGKLSNKTNISQLAEVYYNQYKKDLRSDLLNGLSDSEQNTLMGVINTLPLIS